MDLMQSSEEWSKTHLWVNDLLGQLLNQLRDLGYNPSYHISYDRAEQHLMLESDLLDKHLALRETYLQYVDACAARDAAVEKIQLTSKVDLGFE